METPVSFAPLAARLAAHAAKIRPVDGARHDWDEIGALIVCLMLEMLIALCEALDARAAAEAARLVTAPASRDVAVAAAPALSAGRPTPSSEKRRPRLALAPKVHATAAKPDDAPCGTTGRLTQAGPRLVWSRDWPRDPGPIRAVHAPPWQPRRETRVFAPAIKHARIITIS